MADAQSVHWGAADDASWYQSVERDFGLNARQPENVVRFLLQAFTAKVYCFRDALAVSPKA